MPKLAAGKGGGKRGRPSHDLFGFTSDWPKSCARFFNQSYSGAMGNKPIYASSGYYQKNVRMEDLSHSSSFTFSWDKTYAYGEKLHFGERESRRFRTCTMDIYWLLRLCYTLTCYDFFFVVLGIRTRDTLTLALLTLLRFLPDPFQFRGRRRCSPIPSVLLRQ